MNYILFDDPAIRKALLPFTFTRPVCYIRTGIFTIKDKWERHIGKQVSTITEDYLSQKFEVHQEAENIFVNGAVCPTPSFIQRVASLKEKEVLVKEGIILAYRKEADGKHAEYEENICIIKRPWDIFVFNGNQIKEDLKLIKKEKKSLSIQDVYTRVYKLENIFIEENVKIRAAVLNAEEGPIYIGRNSEIQEGAVVRGPFALCEGAVINMGAKMRGDTTIGPYCKVGGEISNSVLFGYSNKAHDGFLGNSVIGEWCNLGADTNTSNLKNNYGEVQAYNYKEAGMVQTGLQFCGLMMGDHSKAGINTMFNTGTVVGVSANVFGGNFPPKYIPSFSWGGAEGFERFDLDKALKVAERVMKRRNLLLSEEEKNILAEIYRIEEDNWKD